MTRATGRKKGIPRGSRLKPLSPSAPYPAIFAGLADHGEILPIVLVVVVVLVLDLRL
jgi:hypothetical protein